MAVYTIFRYDHDTALPNVLEGRWMLLLLPIPLVALAHWRDRRSPPFAMQD
jgi:hypothetical protein